MAHNLSFAYDGGGPQLQNPKLTTVYKSPSPCNVKIRPSHSALRSRTNEPFPRFRVPRDFTRVDSRADTFSRRPLRWRSTIRKVIRPSQRRPLQRSQRGLSQAIVQSIMNCLLAKNVAMRPRMRKVIMCDNRRAALRNE